MRKAHTSQSSTRLFVTGGLVLIGLLAGCDMGMGPMMGGQAIPVRFQSNGERIYFTGISASGHPITFTGGNMHIQMHGGGCVTCHDVDRRGGIRVMPRFWIVAPPVTPAALFGDHDEDNGGHGDHQGYTVASLRRAITEGMDPSGKRLDAAMPRWSMSEQDLADLVQYLQGSTGQAHVDTPSEGEQEHDDAQ